MMTQNRHIKTRQTHTEIKATAKTRKKTKVNTRFVRKDDLNDRENMKKEMWRGDVKPIMINNHPYFFSKSTKQNQIATGQIEQRNDNELLDLY